MGTMIGLGGLMGGVGAEIGGGSFWRGAGTGFIASALNHAAHSGDLLGKGFAASLKTGRIRHWFKPDITQRGVSIAGSAGMGISLEAGSATALVGPDKGTSIPYVEVGGGWPTKGTGGLMASISVTAVDYTTRVLHPR